MNLINASNIFKDRTVVVREPNGRLRTALPEEYFRMHRIFFDKPDRPVHEPPLFNLRLESNEHFVPGDVLSVFKFFFKLIY